jgi:hypothetical protein
MFSIRKFMILAVLSGCMAQAQTTEAPPDRVSVAFSDPSRPGFIKAGVLNGSITVKGYEGKEVIIEARSRSAARRYRKGEDSGGMRRLDNIATGLHIEEEKNTITVGASSMRTIDITIQAPFNTSLHLHSTNDGDINVERIRGEIEVNNTNGHVRLSNITGVSVAHALNGNIIATFDDVTPGKAMSFSSMNGKIDVTLPASTKAKVILSNDNGDIFSDFDVQMDPSANRAVVEDGRGKGGAYRVRMEKGLSGTINGGGPEYRFKNFNGNIYIRKKG